MIFALNNFHSTSVANVIFESSIIFWKNSDAVSHMPALTGGLIQLVCTVSVWMVLGVRLPHGEY